MKYLISGHNKTGFFRKVVETNIDLDNFKKDGLRYEIYCITDLERLNVPFEVSYLIGRMGLEMSDIDTLHAERIEDMDNLKITL